MKRLILTLGLAVCATGAMAQGLISGGNGTTTLFRTNSVGASGTAGPAVSAQIGVYYYEVLTAASTVTTVDSSLQQLLSGTWSDTQYQGTNSGLAGRVTSGNTVANNWANNTFVSYIVVGWNSVEGSNWGTVSNELVGATLNGGVWSGGHLVQGGFLGASTIQQAEAGGGSPPLGSFAIFGSSGSGQGTPITTTTDMFAVASVPEPGTFALAGLGAASMIIFRRRRK